MKKNILIAVCIALITFIGLASYFYYFRHQESSKDYNETKMASAAIKELFVCNNTQKRISEVLVVNDLSNSIVVFDRNAHGTVEPKRFIRGLSTELTEPTGIALDTRRREIFVTNNKNNSVTVYDSLNNGDIAPKRIIQGPLTNFQDLPQLYTLTLKMNYSFLTVYLIQSPRPAI
jgi:DNA-binding beta-propeller fold protein YncE